MCSPVKGDSLRSVQQIPQHRYLRLDARAQCRIHVRGEVWGVIRRQRSLSALGFGKLLGIGAAQTEVEGGDARLNESGVVFGGRDRRGGDHVLFTESSFERRPEPL